MDLIIDFYKELDALNLIIFWGIIIVIVLLLIFSFVLVNKNKKLKKMVEESKKTEEEIPIKQEEDIQPQIIEKETIMPNPEQVSMDIKEENLVKSVEKEYVEEKEIHFDNNQNTTNESTIKQPIEMPNKPYQRNVLREMSLSQTSPIGINRQVSNETKQTEMVKDLEETLTHEEFNSDSNQETIHKVPQNNINYQIKKEFKSLENTSDRKTEIKEKNNEESMHKEILVSNIDNIPKQNTQELLKQQSVFNNNQKEINNSERYLEEVSRKLAEAEIPDDIERTKYELQQEEDAIISYKELMEKKDSIQTVDEEEAIISIEELMNKTNPTKEETKLYNISEEEANDNFIKELKQFRSDL